MGFLNSIFGGAGDEEKQAKQAFGEASDAAGKYGTGASTINANLMPFLTRELTNPTGFGQAGTTALTSADLAGAGGANSGLVGAAESKVAATNNPSGYATALDQAARERSKAAAGGAEGIAAKNEELKQTQQQSAAKGLEGMYGTDVSGQLGALGIEPKDIQAGVDANSQNWFNNYLKLAGTAAKAAGGFAGA